MKSGGQWLLIRADANTQMGLGHIMRCTALGQAWQDRGGRVCFAMCLKNEKIFNYLSRQGFAVENIPARPAGSEDADRTLQIARGLGAPWIAADGYHFQSDFLHRVRTTGARLLFIDDTALLAHIPADIILNQNPHAASSLYRNCGSRTLLLLGTRFAMIRRDFNGVTRGERAVPRTIPKILVTLGGGDEHNMTGNVLESLTAIENPLLDITVVLGHANPHENEIRKRAAHCHHSLTIYGSANNMPALMAQADMAISSGGSVCWELALMQVPCAVIPIADNQLPIVQCLVQAEAAVSLLPAKNHFDPAFFITAVRRMLEDSRLRKKLTSNAGKLVDGQGAARVVRAMSQVLQ